MMAPWHGPVCFDNNFMPGFGQLQSDQEGACLEDQVLGDVQGGDILIIIRR